MKGDDRLETILNWVFWICITPIILMLAFTAGITVIGIVYTHGMRFLSWLGIS